MSKQKAKSLSVTCDGGTLKATVCEHPDFSGIYVDFISNAPLKDDSYNQTMLMESVEGVLRVLIWDGTIEDYNKQIILQDNHLKYFAKKYNVLEEEIEGAESCFNASKSSFADPDEFEFIHNSYFTLDDYLHYLYDEGQNN